MDLIYKLAAFLAAVAIAFLARQSADELKAWTPWIVRRFIRFAVARLPEHRRGRFDEEWSSHVQDIPGEIGKIFVACGFIFAAVKISLIPQAKTKYDRIERIALSMFSTFVGITALILVFPLMATTAVVVRFHSRGSIFVSRERVAPDGRTFRVLNFRADDGTAYGRLLRRYSFHELPELLNMVRREFILTPQAMLNFLRTYFLGACKTGNKRG